jgi:spore coat-associated protein N
MKNSLSSRKVLIPLATLVAAGAIAVGSGATFTSSSSNSVSAVTAGTLTQTNSKAGAIFTVPAMRPGDVVNGTLTLTNTGSLPATYTLQEPSATNTFGNSVVTGTPSYLHLKITNTTDSTTVFDGNFGALAPATLTDIGSFAAGAAKTYNFAVTLDATAPNSEQGKTAGATFSWVGTQIAGSTTSQ